MKRRTCGLLAFLLLLPACTSTPSPTRLAPKPTTQSSFEATPVPMTEEMPMPATWTPTQTLLPTQTSTVTPSPTMTLSPTHIKTSTSPPTRADVPMDLTLTSTTIQRSDLPPGFEQIEYDRQGVKYLPLEDEGIAAMGAVFYTNRETRSSVLSVTFAFANPASQLIFDQSLDDLEGIMQEKFDELGLYEMGIEVDLQVLQDFPKIGEKSAAAHLELGISGLKTMTDIALFRIEGYGGVVMIVPPATEPNDLEPAALAYLQYSRMVAILSGGS
ncbi:MAG: hypothetical protein P8Z42_02400 [Anaerolineales bacterium]|jgi:hypothetical protein